MKRRIVCFLLAAVMLVGLIPAQIMTVSAASNLKISDQAVEVLKNFEGFRAEAYWDYGQWTIGYGTRCETGEGTVITREQAEVLLRNALVSYENYVNDFADKFGLTLNQHQFDALILFTYNCGEGWMNVDGKFRQSVINGDEGNDFIYNMCLWSNVMENGVLVPHEGLLNRRLCEADMYLNGNYTNYPRSNLNYVLFNAHGGVLDDEMQGYDYFEPPMVKPVPVYVGYRFLGWYTQATGGQWVTTLTEAHADTTLHAHWQQGNGDIDMQGNVMGVSANYQWNASNCVNLNLYKQPNEGAEIAGTMASTDVVTIVADYVDELDIKWGKLQSGNWVLLGSAVPNQPITTETPVQVMVTNTFINVRKEPGVNGAYVGQVHLNDVLTIYRTRTVNGELWGKYSGGWICLKYTNYDIAKGNTSNPDAPVIASGVVVCNNYLRVRQGPGVGYAEVGKLLPGDEVEFTEFKTVGTAKWGRIKQGWISMDYVMLYEETPSQPETPDAPETPDTPSDPETPETPETPSDTVLYTGTVINTNVLRIRAAAGTKNKEVGYLSGGEKVKILEETVVDEAPWGRIAQGWICLYYVQADPSEEDLKNAVTGTVISNTPLNVRSAPGVQNMLVTTYLPGTKVTVYQQRIVNNVAWGRTDKGWVCLQYVKLDTTTGGGTTGGNTGTDKPTTPDTPAGEVLYTGTIVDTDALRVRKGAGTNFPEVGRMKSGTKVKLYELTTAGGMPWGRCDQGWICLLYVQLDPTASNIQGAVTGTVISGIDLKIRSAAGVTNPIVGALRPGSKTTVYEQTMVNGVPWGRTDKGWICLTYVRLAVPMPSETVKPEEPEKPDTPVDPEVPEEPEDPETPVDPEKPEEPEKNYSTGSVIKTNELRVRVAPGVANQEVTRLTLGTKVKIYEQKTVDNAPWGRIDQGWVCMYYIQVDPTAEDMENGIMGTVTSNMNLNIRANAGTQYALVGSIPHGTRIVIYDYVTVNNVQWGRIDRGWVCLLYVKLDSALPEKPVEPETPDEPEKPDTPVDPEDPDEPDTPVDPEDPDDPDEPEDPEEPVDPTKVESLSIIVTEESLAQLLTIYPNLKKLDLRGSTCYDAIVAFIEAHPEIEVIYSVSLGKVSAVSTATVLELKADDFVYETLCTNLKYLPKVTKIVLRATALTLEEITSFAEGVPGINVAYTVDVCGVEVASEAIGANLSHLTEAKVEEAVAKFALLPNLTEVDLMNSKGTSALSMAGVKKLMELAPHLKLNYTFGFYGKNISLDAESVSLAGVYIGNSGEANVRLALDILKNCKTMILDNCGIDNDVMASIRADYPDVDVAWRVYYGSHYKMGNALSNTEVLRHVYGLNDTNCGNLKYFNKVKYIDFGHNTSLTNLDYIANMPDLEIVILSGSPIKDLSPFANCKKLVFLELAWCGHITDISPLAGCDSLANLNISFTGVKDLSPIEHLDMERLSIMGFKVSAADRNAYIAGHPECVVVYQNPDSPENPYGVGWRYEADGSYTTIYRRVRDVFGYDNMPT